MTKDLRELSYDQLVEYSAQVFKEVRRRAYAEDYGQGKFDAEMDFIDGEYEAIESPQQARDRIVEQAKADVEELKRPGYAFGGSWEYAKNLDGCGNRGSGTRFKCEFIIDKEKRTVVALLRGFRSGHVYTRGIAKCTPGDCFNSAIGKAIALRRALGLEVPAEYLNVPQPTEVRVGDRILLVFNGRVETVSGFNYGGYVLTEESPGCAEKDDYKIIDDSREGVTQ